MRENKVLDNDSFVKKYLQKIVAKYAHQQIVICHGEIFTGAGAVECARKKYPKTTPLFFPVPGSEEFNHLL